MTRSTAGERPVYLPTLRKYDLVLAIDPGLTTGLALIRVSPETEAGFLLLHAREVPWSARFELQRFVAQVDHIVIESFRLYAHKAQDQINASFPSAQVIGIVDAYADRYGKLERIREQPASLIAKVQILPQHVDDVRGSEHMKDAYKHARLFATICKKGWER